jgi:hypothetical protein
MSILEQPIMKKSSKTPAHGQGKKAKSKKQPQEIETMPKDPPGYNRFVDDGLEYMSITMALGENGATATVSTRRTNKNPGEYYGFVVVKLPDGQSTEYKTQPGSQEEVMGYMHSLTEKLRAGEQPPK